ncbi:MAG: OmpH family outer membrane protein [Alphaproteobacteria bacterium]|jgi:Skp family chaperone for outer membrane proteins|nr:OmpH family outer membrane protein [Alphaproteobacteria bacterium]
MIFYHAPRWLLALTLAFALLAASPSIVGTTSAQDSEPESVRLGVVDRQKIVRVSVAGQGLRTEFEATEARYREEISAKESALRAQQEELQRQRTLLSPEAFAAREAEFAKKVEALQREVATRNKDLEAMLGYGMQQIDVAALKIIAEIADEYAITLVLDKTQLLMVAKTYEFSDEVLKRLNERVPSVPSSPPPAEADNQ